jgi:excisionase family DNA binding protein
MHQIPEHLITATIGNFCALSNIGRSKVYELLDAGDLQSIKIGKRRLILIDSYHRLIERQRSIGASAPSASTGD